MLVVVVENYIKPLTDYNPLYPNSLISTDSQFGLKSWGSKFHSYI